MDMDYEIPMEYDPNLALAIVWGSDLEEAKARGIRFLDSVVLEGDVGSKPDDFYTNINYLKVMTDRLLEF